MAFRGGRGRGRGGRGGQPYERHAAQTKFELFPDVKLPAVPKVVTKEELMLINWKFQLERFWKGSCYYLVDKTENSKVPDTDIQRFSDTINTKTQTRRENFASYLKLTSSNFPVELIQGGKKQQISHKKLRWDKNSENKKMDLFEKLEKSGKIEGETTEKKGDSDEEEEVLEEEEEEDSDDGDYNQNVDFDDDEDDLNMPEEEDEGTYDY